jgi:hypothetical protein
VRVAGRVAGEITRVAVRVSAHVIADDVPRERPTKEAREPNVKSCPKRRYETKEARLGRHRGSAAIVIRRRATLVDYNERKVHSRYGATSKRYGPTSRTSPRFGPRTDDARLGSSAE